jgi:hypothetical protein
MTRRCQGSENPPINWCGAGSVTYSSNVYSTGITLNMSTSSKIIMRADQVFKMTRYIQVLKLQTQRMFIVNKRLYLKKKTIHSFIVHHHSMKTGKFVGMRNTQVADNFGNQYFLGNPTTIVDLGPKDNIIKNVCAQPEFQGYVLDTLKATSFQGISDLIQFFIISRLTNASFLERLLSLGDSSISELFSRPAQKIDGDFAQLNSINNEIGVVPFSPESYSQENLFYGATPKPVVGVFFSSDTVTRDYISPGREIFVDTPTKFGYNTFGHKTQQVPMYRWEIKQGDAPSPSIFGGEMNNWLTSPSDFYVTPYQGIDRLNDSTYFASEVKHPTGQRPGYIYNSIPLKDISGNVTGFTYTGYTNTSIKR